MGKTKNPGKGISGNPAKRAEQEAERAAAVPATVEQALTRTVAVEYDGQTWNIDPQVLQSPEMLYRLAELQSFAEDGGTSDEATQTEMLGCAMGVIRLMFGRVQGRNFARGASDLDQLGARLHEFFGAASTRAGSPDPTDGSGSSAGTEALSTQPSDAATA